MEPRLRYWSVAPEGYQALTALYRYLPGCGLEAALLHLVFLRISQINGCAYCVDLHWRDALAAGESARRVNAIVAWREMPFFSPRERAAFAWAESLTLIAESRAADPDYAVARAQFTDKELADLTFAIGLMNMLNRVAVGFRRGPAPEPEPKSPAS